MRYVQCIIRLRWMLLAVAAVALVASALAASALGALGPAKGIQLWAARYDGSGGGDDRARSVAVSRDGTKVFVSGYSDDGATTGYDYATVAYAAANGANLWTARYTGPGHGSDFPASLAVSADGTKVFVAGTSQALLDSWGYPVVDYATVAYNAATGAQLWAKRYNGPANRNDLASSLAVSADGTKVFVTGGSDSGTNGYDYATIAYSAATGTKLWVASYNGPGNWGDGAESIAVSGDGTRVFVTGGSYGGQTTGPDYATIAYNASTGAQLWASRYDRPGGYEDGASALGLSRDGTKLFVTGHSTPPGSWYYDYGTVAYDALTGKKLWVASYNGPANASDSAKSIAVSGDGTKVFVGGTSWGGATTLSDYATLAYEAATGARLWTARYNGSVSGVDWANSLALSGDGTKVFVSGASGYGGGTGIDYATVAYDAASGTKVWTGLYDGPSSGYDEATSVAVSPAESNGGTRFYVTGGSQGSSFDADYATFAYWIS